MSLQKQGVNLPFGQGVDTKTDPNQVAAGKMIGLSNVVFDNGGMLRKRDGFGAIAAAPSNDSTVLTTFNGDLVATGNALYGYVPASQTWYNKGTVQPISVDVTPLVRSNQSQSVCSSSIAPDGTHCTVYVETLAAGGSAPYYQISNDKQVVIPKVSLPATASNPKTLFVYNSFFVFFQITTNTALQYIRIPIGALSSPTAAATMATGTAASYYDVCTYNNAIYFMWRDGSTGAIKLNVMSRVGTLGTSFQVSTATTPTNLTLAADASSGYVWPCWWDSGIPKLRTAAFALGSGGSIVTTPVLAVTDIAAGTGTNIMTAVANNNVLTMFWTPTNTYPWGGEASCVTSYTVTLAGAVAGGSVLRRGVRIASKPFYSLEGIGYLFVIANSTFQCTNFLMDFSGKLIAKLAYANSSVDGISPVPVQSDGVIHYTYLFKDFVVPVNRSENGAQAPGGLYSQTGVNMAMFTINSSQQSSAEIGSSLYLTGGLMWQYDGVLAAEQGFHLYPEDLNLTATAGGNMSNQQYYYVATYEWTDNQGLLHRSAPSLPFGYLGAGGNKSCTIKIPTLRVTDKISPNPVRIVLYRWSTAQQIYYQCSPIPSSIENDTTVDYVTFVDTLADASILGNTILYTTGGVLEHIATPACYAATLHRSRMFFVDAEDRNLLWFSNKVIEATPLEFSDLLTLYVPPTTGAQGSTGDITALASLDDKLIIFKNDAIYYITGDGPDITGNNNDYSEPVYITGTAGCINQRSVTLTPMGIVFQSDKGIWLLGRDLSTTYIGADVEMYNSNTVKAGACIPGTNQVRFTLDNGLVLVYDYYYKQWCTFTGISGVSSCLYQNKHTFLTSKAKILQETKGNYIDDSSPVLVSFTTAWLKLTNLQGFQRAYSFSLLGNYISPHKLGISIAFDYDPSIKQTVVYTPSQKATTYGSDSLYGGSSVYGGISPLEQFRVFLSNQKCQSVQISLQEQFDSSQGTVPGAGLTLSGINLLLGAKDSKPKFTAAQSKG